MAPLSRLAAIAEHLAPSRTVARLSRMPRVPGRVSVSSRHPYELVRVERPEWLGDGPIRVTIAAGHCLIATESAASVEMPVPVLYAPGMRFEVEPWQAAVYGRKLTPAAVMRWYLQYAPELAS